MTTKNQNTPAVQKQKEITESVLERVNALEQSGGLRLPKNYSPENAIKAAWLVLQDTKNKDKKPVLEVCTRPSVIRSLFKMCVQGLNVMKAQGDFIAHGDQLTWRERVNGRVAMAKRYGNVKEVVAYVIRKGDDFKYSHDLEVNRIKITDHVSSFENMDNEIIGAYAIVYFTNDTPPYTELMTIKQVKKAWDMAFGETKTHKEFPEEMVKKTVVGRSVKLWINTSDDAALMDDDDDQQKSVQESMIQDHINENANKGSIDIDAEDVQEVNDDPPAEKQEPEKRPEPEQEREPAETDQGTLGPNF